MAIAMRPADAKQWFGKVPPDLSVIVRARTSFDYKGADYLYSLAARLLPRCRQPDRLEQRHLSEHRHAALLLAAAGPARATIERVLHEAGGKAWCARWRCTTRRNVTVTRTPCRHAAEGMSYSFKPADPARPASTTPEMADLVAFLPS